MTFAHSMLLCNVQNSSVRLRSYRASSRRSRLLAALCLWLGNTCLDGSCQSLRDSLLLLATGRLQRSTKPLTSYNAPLGSGLVRLKMASGRDGTTARQNASCPSCVYAVHMSGRVWHDSAPCVGPTDRRLARKSCRTGRGHCTGHGVFHFHFIYFT